MRARYSPHRPEPTEPANINHLLNTWERVVCHNAGHCGLEHVKHDTIGDAL